jgi:hypothetical protein
MKTVYSAPNIALVSLIRTVLEEHGIACRLKNEFLSAGMGELPPIECWPQLCVGDDDFAEASRLVQEALKEQVSEPWRCNACGEEMEGQFGACWNCGSVRPAENT